MEYLTPDSMVITKTKDTNQQNIRCRYDQLKQQDANNPTLNIYTVSLAFNIDQNDTIYFDQNVREKPARNKKNRKLFQVSEN